MGLFSKIAGIIGTKLQIDVVGSGPTLKNSGGVLEFRNAADSAYAIARGLTPVGNNDLTTKAYVDQLASRYIVTAQANAVSALIANTGVEHFIVVSTPGTGAAAAYIAGAILWDDGTGVGNVGIIAPNDNAMIATTIAFAGGTFTFLANSLYLWDAVTSSWINVGGSSISGCSRTVRYAITNAASQDSAVLLPIGAYVSDVILEVVTPYSGGATISIGQAGSLALIMGTGDNLATVANLYKVEQRTTWGGTALVIRTTVAGTPAAGAGFVHVTYSVPDA